jgi:hypothetical protein
MSTTLDAIQFAAKQEPANFQDAISSMLMDKIKERLSVEKMSVAQKLFNNEYTEDITDETTDEGSNEEV